MLLVGWAPAHRDRSDDRRRTPTVRQEARDLAVTLTAEALGVPRDLVELRRRCDRCGEDGHGRPWAEHAGRRWEVSHAGCPDGTVAAVAPWPIGVDLETVGDVDVAVAEVALSPGERRWWHDRPPAHRPADLARAWVRKEAVLKAAGTGLTVDPAEVVLGPPGGPPTLRSWPVEVPVDRVVLRDLPVPTGWVAAVAVVLDHHPLTVR